MRNTGSGDATGFWRVVALSLLLVEALLFARGRGSLSLHASSTPRCVRPPIETMTRVASGAVSTTGDDASCAAAAAPSFWALGVAVATDKVTLPETAIGMSHTYQFAYERYIRPRRCEALAMLEIGLGCGMPYRSSGGPSTWAATPEGHSVPLWLAFLPRATLNIFEYKADCATRFKANDPLRVGAAFARMHMFTGDQSKDADLLKAMAVMGSQDIIIDDGGHSMMQQQTSFRVLFPFVKPGGICEDTQSLPTTQLCLTLSATAYPRLRHHRGHAEQLFVDGSRVARQAGQHGHGRLCVANHQRAALARARSRPRQGRLSRPHRASSAHKERRLLPRALRHLSLARGRAGAHRDP